jgi:hypothetical protein
MRRGRDHGGDPVKRSWIGAAPGWFANPTLWLLALGGALFSAGLAGYGSGALSDVAVVLVNAVAIYLSFTVLHDAMHGTAHEHRRVNAVLGRVAAIPLTISDRCVSAIRKELPDAGKCEAALLNATAKKVKSILGCNAKAAAMNLAVRRGLRPEGEGQVRARVRQGRRLQRRSVGGRGPRRQPLHRAHGGRSHRRRDGRGPLRHGHAGAVVPEQGRSLRELRDRNLRDRVWLRQHRPRLPGQNLGGGGACGSGTLNGCAHPRP